MKICPLCGKELVPFPDKTYGFSCTVKVFDNNTLRHYYEDDDRIVMYTLPYSVVTFVKFSCSFIDYLKSDSYPYSWTELTCTSVISPDTEENLRKRIKTLLMFI